MTIIEWLKDKPLPQKTFVSPMGEITITKIEGEVVRFDQSDGMKDCYLDYNATYEGE